MLPRFVELSQIQQAQSVWLSMPNPTPPAGSPGSLRRHWDGLKCHAEKVLVLKKYLWVFSWNVTQPNKACPKSSDCFIFVNVTQFEQFPPALRRQKPFDPDPHMPMFTRCGWDALAWNQNPDHLAWLLTWGPSMHVSRLRLSHTMWFGEPLTPLAWCLDCFALPLQRNHWLGLACWNNQRAAGALRSEDWLGLRKLVLGATKNQC